MAKYITTDGRVEHIYPSNGTDFSLAELQEAVGGDIETVGVGDLIMVLNEEGKLNDLPYNEKATQIAHTHRLIFPDDYIAGNVVLCNYNEIK